MESLRYVAHADVELYIFYFTLCHKLHYNTERGSDTLN